MRPLHARIHARANRLSILSSEGLLLLLFLIRMTHFQLTCEHMIKGPVCLARNTQISALVHHLQDLLAGEEFRGRLHGESTSTLPEKVRQCHHKRQQLFFFFLESESIASSESRVSIIRTRSNFGVHELVFPRILSFLYRFNGKFSVASRYCRVLG